MGTLILVGMVLLALAGVGPVSGMTLVKNGGFELPPLGESTGFAECPDGVVQDWSIGGAGVDHIRTYWTPSEGDHSLDLSRRGGGSVSQLIPTTAGGSYTLSFDMAGNPECGPLQKRLMVYWGSEPGYGPYTFSASTRPHIGPGGWTTITMGELPGAAGGTRLTFEDVSTPSSACGVALDNVIVISNGSVPVPEFPTMALPVGAIVGILGAVFYIRSTREQ